MTRFRTLFSPRRLCYVICLPEWEAIFVEAARQTGTRPVFIRNASVRDLVPYSCLFVDLEQIVFRPDLLQWVAELDGTRSANLSVVPYYVRETPDFETISRLAPALTLYQARQWTVDNALSRIVYSSSQLRWTQVASQYRNIVVQAYSLFEIPWIFFRSAGFLFLPASFLISLLLPFESITRLLAFGALCATGPWFERACRRRRQTSPVPRESAVLRQRAFAFIIATIACLAAARIYGLQITTSFLLASWLISIICEQIGQSMTRRSHAEAWCSAWLDQRRGISLSPDEPVRLLPREDESEASYLVRKSLELVRLGLLFRGDNPHHWPNVFISHRNDPRGIELSRLLFEQLQQRGLLRPFLDLEHLREGQWRTTLGDALDRCGIFVAILTDLTQKDWVQRELEGALTLAVLYGSPHIYVVEVDYSLDDLHLDPVLASRVQLAEIPRISPQQFASSAKLQQFAAELERTLQRPPAMEFLPVVNVGVHVLRFVSWLAFVVVVLLGLGRGVFPERGTGAWSLLCFVVAMEFSGLREWLYVVTKNNWTENRDVQSQRYLTALLYPFLLISVSTFLIRDPQQQSAFLLTLNAVLAGLVINLSATFFLETLHQDPRRPGRAISWLPIASSSNTRLLILTEESWTRKIREVVGDQIECLSLDSVVELHTGDRIILQAELLLAGSFAEFLLELLQPATARKHKIRLLLFGTSSEVIDSVPPQTRQLLDRLQADQIWNLNANDATEIFAAFAATGNRQSS